LEPALSKNLESGEKFNSLLKLVKSKFFFNPV
jgi:hypothetical protein